MVLSEDMAGFLMAIAALAIAGLALKAGSIIKKMIEEKKEKQERDNDVRHDSSQ